MTDDNSPNQEEIELEETSEEIVEKELTLEEKFALLEEKLEKVEAEVTYRDAEIINVRKKMSAEKISYELKRYSGIKRDYTEKEVERLKNDSKDRY